MGKQFGVFVSGLGSQTTIEEVKGLFQGYGRVRSAFKSSVTSDGDGWTAIVLMADASGQEKAIANVDGSTFDGQNLQAKAVAKGTSRSKAPNEPGSKKLREQADGDKPSKKGKSQEPLRKTDKKPQQSKDKPSTSGVGKHPQGKPAYHARKHELSGEQRQALMRAVVVVPATEDTIPPIISAAKKAGKVSSVDATPSEAILGYCKAEPLLHEKANAEPGKPPTKSCLVYFDTIKSALAAVALLHRQPAGDTMLWARQAGGDGRMCRQFRVIIRNLPFKATKEKLIEALSAVAFAWDVTFPTKDDGSSRGFAFATFMTRAYAGKVIKEINGKELLGRVVAVDWALDKAHFTSAMEDETKAAEEAEALAAAEEGLRSEKDGAEGDGGEAQDEPAGDEEGDGDGDDAEEEAEVNEREVLHKALDTVLQLGQKENTTQQDPRAVSSRAESKVPPHSRRQPQKQLGKELEDGDRDGNVEEGMEGQDAEERAREEEERKIKCTVFVRGLPTDTTSKELQEYLLKFGAVKQARLVHDKTTGLPKGTAFVEFADPAPAKSVAAASKKGRMGQTAALQLRNHALIINPALLGGQARELAANRADGKKEHDPRNLYLAREGLIEEGSAVWEGLSKLDQQRRQRSWREKQEKLKSPNFCVSKVRLAIRNIPKKMDEKSLKEAVRDAVLEYSTKAKPKIKQVKLLRETDSLQTKEAAKGRHKGRGFVEFDNHEHALAALRALNNNPSTAFGSTSRPIVEFAIDNVHKLRLHKQRLEQADQRRSEQGTKPGKSPQEKEVVQTGTAPTSQTTVGDGKQQPTQKVSKWKAIRERQKQVKLLKQQKQQLGEQQQQDVEKGQQEGHAKMPGQQATTDNEGAGAGRGSRKRKRKGDGGDQDGQRQRRDDQSDGQADRLINQPAGKRKRNGLMHRERDLRDGKDVAWSDGKARMDSKAQMNSLDGRQGGKRLGKKKKGGGIEEERLDDLIAQYKRRFFSS